MPEEFDLKHHNKILDTSAIFRFSGLPNNAQLELVPAKKVRSESEITLALNLENGNRLVGNFIPSDNLLRVLEQLCPDCLPNIKSPVVIYMRQEIYGQNLETTSLRSLGITGGRAMIRLIDKAPEELKEQANVATPLPHKPVEEKPYIRKIKESSFTEVDPSPVEANKIDLKSDDNMHVEPSNIVENKSNSFKKGGTVDLIKLAKEKRKNTDSSSIQEKRANVSSGNSNKCDVVKKNNFHQSMETCECKRDETMEIDCCGKCQENCINVPEDNIEDQFVFVSAYIFLLTLNSQLIEHKLFNSNVASNKKKMSTSQQLRI